MATELTTESFSSKVIKGKGGAVIDFWAPWCGPCKMMAPVFDEVAQQYGDVLFGKLNVDDCGDVAGQFDVQSIPTIIYFRDGKEVNRTLGAMTKEQFMEEVEKII